MLYRIILDDGLGEPVETELHAEDHAEALDEGLTQLGDPLSGRDEGDITIRLQRAD